MIALLEDIGYGELLLIAVAGVLLFGKRLPEVASQAAIRLAVPLAPAAAAIERRGPRLIAG